MKISSAVNLLWTLTAVALVSCNKDNDPDFPESYPCRAKVEVIDYCPAPGQFVNVLPEIKENSQTIKEVESALNEGRMVTLGAWGGYVTLKLERDLTNLAGQGDFVVLGNAFEGSSEPGIVEVSVDGARWYALRGDCYDEAERVTVKYSRGSSDESHVVWKCYSAPGGELLEEGVIPRNEYHSQDYFPTWMAVGPDGCYTFTGQRLPDNCIYDETTGNYVRRAYKGYADTYANDDPRAALDISDAVTAQGTHVALQSIRYIRIYTGVLQVNGPIGECSTEVSGIRLLHK